MASSKYKFLKIYCVNKYCTGTIHDFSQCTIILLLKSTGAACMCQHRTIEPPLGILF